MHIKLNKLRKQFDDNLVLDDIDFDDEISTLAIIGPSGGGKSTLLRLLGGLISKTSGDYYLNEELITENNMQNYIKNVGFVFQQNGLLSHLSAISNITLPLIKVHNYSKEDAYNRAFELLKRFGLENDINKLPKELSGGQIQRISIARAIAHKPQFLLLDEPTSALDPEYTTEVLDLVNELKKEGMNFIIVTHEMGFAYHACDKVAFLTGGKLEEYGKTSEVFKNPKSEKLKIFLSKLLGWNMNG